MQAEIELKLNEQLTKGIVSEAQVVYSLVQIRKLLELQNFPEEFEYLKFHCDWALHSKITGQFAQEMLKQFSDANTILRNGAELKDLPLPLSKKIESISKMIFFKTEFEEFIRQKNFTPFDNAPKDWGHFLYLYTSVIKDISLNVRSDNTHLSITRVIVDVQTKRVDGEVYFKVEWNIHDRNGANGQIFVINSFTCLTKKTPETLWGSGDF